MSNAAHGLFIKYGLQHEPTDSEVRQWHDRTQALIGIGTEPNKAGAAAAQAIFRDYNTMVYASEADTITALLRAAAGK